MFPGRVTLSTDVPSLFADVLTKPADLAIGDHGPHNRDSVNRALLKVIGIKNILFLILILVHDVSLCMTQ